MSLIISPEAQNLYDQTLARACARSFIFEWSSQAETERLMRETFFQAACVNELADGTPVGSDRVLDLAEARLAAAALHRAADGEYLIAADEARDAHEQLQATLQVMTDAPLHGQNYADWLVSQSQSRAVGWRRIRPAFTRSEIRGAYRNAQATQLDSRPGMNAVDAVFMSLALNMEAGGNDSDISYSDVWNASSQVESAIRYIDAMSTPFRDPGNIWSCFP
ncbi:MAG: hypothetical protein U1F57_01425 [bacterium]